MKKYILPLFIGLTFLQPVFAQEIAQQIISVNLGEILSIENVKVEHITYHKNEPMYNVRIKSVDKTLPNLYPLGLSPMIVKIHTNLSTPIYVNAQFLELKHAVAPYSFPTSDIGFSPNSYTINSPYDGVETGVFTPVAVARTNTIQGSYIGKILFTLGAI